MDQLLTDEEAATEYVRALFLYVLDRKAMSEEEVSYWTREVMGGRSAGDVLQLFIESEEFRSRQRAQQGHPTHYPHGHFYSPVVNVEEAQSQAGRIFARRPPACVQLDAAAQIARLARIARYIPEMPFSEEAKPPLRYYYNNTSYGFGDASIYWGMIGDLRPARIMEVGSGFTSALALDAIDHFGLDTRCTFIDPHPELLRRVAAPIGPQHDVIPDLVQNVDPAIVEELGPNDLLFIDSSHVVKTGSDVHFELTQLLPRVKPGVIVHFHDVFYPFEYPRGWVIDDNYSWNELYFLHTFLMYNDAFEVVYFNDFIGKDHADRLRQLLPGETSSRMLLNPGGGLWLRRLETPTR
jgi:hypothetical protein